MICSTWMIGYFFSGFLSFHAWSCCDPELRVACVPERIEYAEVTVYRAGDWRGEVTIPMERITGNKWLIEFPCPNMRIEYLIQTDQDQTGRMVAE
jgi:hypothetical protein